MSPTTIAFHHFGCKVNFAEASSISRQFREKGFELKNHHEVADIYVISTCVVTAVAEKKCRAAIHQAHKLNPDAKIAVIGCFSELKPGELSQIEGVDLVLGNSSKYMLIEELEKLKSPDYHGGFNPGIRGTSSFVPSFSFGDRTRSFLKIQDGCDYYCSYCTIPLARGHSRSDTIAHVISSAQEIVKNGIREIVLTGVNIGDFGRHNGENFFQLIQALDQLKGLVRLRISSIEPDLLSDEIIDFASTSLKFMPHFHIPLQSGSDKILKAMKRKYSLEVYSGRVERIRQKLPLACIASDIIVGFPGESEDDFRDTVNYIGHLPVSYMHVFTYSKRENTLASLISEEVPGKIKKERSKLLHHLSKQKKQAFYQQNLNREVNVLFESDNSQGWMHGFSENYIKVKTKFNSALSNQVRKVRLQEMDDEGVYIFE
ncbi:MAG: tRNA (N(6)-L-threonylcarbamoyladenosine(37)-C(2))-methylthiotransferase MtaB [Bacteroidetes bacterium]|nr:tRNA (N(6)-L-threonylcarbamoyladenosine(37)-C(2))-methylthiotransferase MtaB [Bacteroidota bacterium]